MRLFVYPTITPRDSSESPDLLCVVRMRNYPMAKYI